MLTNREKRLVYLLIVVVVIMATGLFFYFRYTDLQQVGKDIDRITKQIQMILSSTPAEESVAASISELEKQIEAEKKRFYAPDEIDLPSFSTIVRDLMDKNGLSVTKVSRASKPKVRYVEFQLSGSAYNMARFLLAVSTYEKYWTITNLSMDNKSKDGKKMDFSLRIDYEVNSAANN